MCIFYYVCLQILLHIIISAYKYRDTESEIDYCEVAAAAAKPIITDINYWLNKCHNMHHIKTKTVANNSKIESYTYYYYI